MPEGHPLRQWADTFPWAALGSAIEQSFDPRFPKLSHRGRRPVPIRVVCALELLKHELGTSEEEIGHRLRTDFAVMSACGLRDYQGNPSQAHFVFPETLCALRSRIDEAFMDARLAIQAASAIEAGLVSPAHRVLDTFPCAQGSQRVTDATTLSNAQKNPPPHHSHHAAVRPPRHGPHRSSPGAPPGADKSQNEAVLWETLHACGILTVGNPKTVEPIKTPPSAQDVLDTLNEAG